MRSESEEGEPGGDTSRNNNIGNNGGYGDPYSRAPTAYRDRGEPRGYADYRMADPYGAGRGAGNSGGLSGSRRSRSRSPMSSRRRHEGDRENPPAGRCIGIFGLSIYTKETDLHEVFSRYGPLDNVQIVYDAQSGRSRGFAFVYFQNVADAAEAKDRCNGMEIDGRKIRVDFSLTQRAHTPTPGIYMGKSHPRSYQASGPPSSYGHSRNTYSSNPYPSHRSNHMHNHHSSYPSHQPRSRYPQHYPSAVHDDRRRVTRSRSASPRKYYY